MANGGILGELDHPKDRDDICTEKVAICMPEVPVRKNDGKYYCKFNILDTPCGRIVYTLAKAGVKLGVSSRGNGDYDEYTGEVDPNSYDFTCFDVVILPAVKEARMNLITESLDNDKPFNLLLKEQLDRSSDKDKKVMTETLNNLGINLNEDLSNKSNTIDKCVICGAPIEGYGNNAEPVKKGKCCDKCNQEIVIPARLKNIKLTEDKDETADAKSTEELPDVEIKKDILGIDEEDENKDKSVAEPEDEKSSENEELDDKIKELFQLFLEKEKMDIEEKDEKEKEFISLFHELFPEFSCCTDECDDIEVEENKELVSKTAGNDGVEESNDYLLEQLEATLKDNKALKEELKKAQADKAVGNSKVSKLNEDLNQFKNIAALAGKQALKAKKCESENVKLKEELKTLKEDFNKVVNDSKEKESLIKSLETNNSNISKEKSKLEENLKTSSQSSNIWKEKYQKSTVLVEKYKQFAHKIANKYIDTKALSLGVSVNEIKNRLNENYSLNDVDKVCDDLQRYSINISKLPFQLDKSENMRVRLREDKSKDPLGKMDSQYDDTVDDYLLDLAGLLNK